jgi:hypothetical protein
MVRKRITSNRNTPKPISACRVMSAPQEGPTDWVVIELGSTLKSAEILVMKL